MVMNFIWGYFLGVINMDIHGIIFNGHINIFNNIMGIIYECSWEHGISTYISGYTIGFNMVLDQTS